MKQGKFMRLTPAQIAWLAQATADGRSEASVIGELIDKASSGTWLQIPTALLNSYRREAGRRGASLEHVLLLGLDAGTLEWIETREEEEDEEDE